ncbi:MAG: glutamyl-tRNA reductase [Acidobacteriota bacterium]
MHGPEAGGHLLLEGLSFREASLADREGLSFGTEAIDAALARLAALPGVREAMVLSTCNRTEIAVAGPDVPAEPLVEVLGPRARRVRRYRHQDGNAALHLFRLASGLDSQVVGEPQIQGQIARAHSLSAQHGLAGAILGHLVESALHVGRRIRETTGLTQAASSVSAAAVALARTFYESLAGKRILVLGAGSMGSHVARRLCSEGATDLVICNRTVERAVELAAKLGARASGIASLELELAGADLVLAGLAECPGIVTRPMMGQALAARQGRPVLVIDIALPRNVEPACHGLPGSFVYDMDDLEAIVAMRRSDLAQQIAEAEALARKEAERAWGRRLEREVVPDIVALRDRLEAIRKSELARLGHGLPPEQELVLDEVTRSLVNKILHGPLTALREAAQAGDADRMRSVVRTLFQIPS